LTEIPEIVRGKWMPSSLRKQGILNPVRTDYSCLRFGFSIRAIGKKRARQEAGEDRPSPSKKPKKALAESAKKETAVVLKKTKPSAPSKANGKSLFFYKTVVLSQGAQLSIQSCSLFRNGRSKI
jgi:hypothetical protein